MTVGFQSGLMTRGSDPVDPYVHQAGPRLPLYIIGLQQKADSTHRQRFAVSRLLHMHSASVRSWWTRYKTFTCSVQGHDDYASMTADSLLIRAGHPRVEFIEVGTRVGIQRCALRTALSAHTPH